MAEADYYKLLGVAQDADEHSIRTAIRTTRGRYRQQAGSPSLEQRSKAERVMAQIAEAETVFESPESRNAYDARLAARQATPPQPQEQSAQHGHPGDRRAPQKDWFKAAEDYLAAGESRHAVGAAKEATHANPSDPRAWQLRARASLEEKDFRDAEFAATEAMKLMPGDGAGPGLRGDVLRAERRFGEAVDAYRAAAQVDPDSSVWPTRVAFTLIDQDLPKDAVAQARETLVRFAGEQGVRDALARVLVADCEAAMSNDQNHGVYIASKKQVAHIESRLEEINTLEPLGSTERAFRDQLAMNLAAAKSRRFLMPPGKLILWVLGWVFFGTWLSWFILSLILGDALGIVAAFALNVGLACALALRLFPQQWQLNRQVLGDAWARTGL